MIIPLIEPTSTRYVHVNPKTNRVHVLVPFVGGQDISTDNTCRSTTELNAFFGGGGFSELESYRSVLEFHISLLDAGDARCAIKKERLAQINSYLDALRNMGEGYQDTVNAFLAKPSNLYSIQLRPRVQDPETHVVNPVFTIDRGNDDNSGTPLSPLYNQMHEVFPGLTLGKTDPCTQLITSTLSALPHDASFEDIQHALAEQCQSLFSTPVDFQNYIKHTPGRASENQVVTKAHIDQEMGFFNDATPEDYIDALLGFCAPNLSNLYTGSPFYLGTYTTPAEQAERLSIMTQFYLAVLNIHCRAQGISSTNFGEVLDHNAALSQKLVNAVSQALSRGNDVEKVIIMFFFLHEEIFNLSRALSVKDRDAIQAKFETTYRTVTATKENPHMDDFMILDTEARGARDIFFTQKGLIGADFAHIVPTSEPNQDYFTEIRQEAATHPYVMRPQDEAVITVDIEPEVLIDKLDDIQWDKLPVELVHALRSLPAFQMRQFTDDVAKGQQDDAETILNASDSSHKQALLTTPTKFSDHSGRMFNCTAYEYAYWAKDTHMRSMLERHMDDTTKTYLLDKIDEMELSGLAYQQHGIDYKNPHYDVSFVLKELGPDEFYDLQTMVGQNIEKIQDANADTYKNLPFTATEYEHLKKELEQHKQYRLTSFFYASPANAIANKLNFDFKSLITALDIFVAHYDNRDYNQLGNAWLDVGKAQREVPAHVAQEYCRQDRSFRVPTVFDEPTLPRDLTLNHWGERGFWFPLASSSFGCGFDFGILRGSSDVVMPLGPLGPAQADGSANRGAAWHVMFAKLDLAAVRGLETIRTMELSQSREIMDITTPNHSLGI